jgi:hypothetical protein
MSTPLERSPKNPLPPNFVPLGGRSYRVKDGDSWQALTTRHGISSPDGPKALVHYNFQTFDPCEVNWYLRHRVGCKKVSPDGKNWSFSSAASPGIIYLPPIGTNTVVAPEPDAMFPDPRRVKVDKGGCKTALGKALDIPDHDYMNYLGFGLGLFDALGTAAEVFAVEVGVAGTLGTATALGTVLTVGLPVLGLFANFLNLGGPYADATDFHVKKKMKSGYSEGVVAGALRKPQDFVRSQYAQLQTNSALVRDIGPALAAKVRDAYNGALALGYANGLTLNNPQRYTLLWDLHNRLDEQDRKEAARNRNGWDDRSWRLYCDALSIQFQKHHLK